MGIEVVFVSIVMRSLFRFLRLRYQSSQLTSLLKHLLYYAMTNTAILVFVIIFTIISYFRYRHPVKPLTLATAIVSRAVLPFLDLASTVMLSLLAIRPENCKCLCGNICDHKR